MVEKHLQRVSPRLARFMVWIAVVGACLIAGCGRGGQQDDHPYAHFSSQPQPVSPKFTVTEPTPKPTPTPTPRPKPNLHAHREVAHTYWNGIVIASIMADVARQMAGSAIGDDDLVLASRYFRLAQQYSGAAAKMADEHVPPGWEDVRDAARSSSLTIAEAYGTAQTALDSGKPSDIATALDQSDAARERYAEALHLARVHYIAIGGKWSDLTDGSEEATGLAAVVKSAAEANQ
jgi:hypothetical protein